MNIATIIPFRLKSSRFPNKALYRYNGVPIIEHALKISERIETSITILTSSREDFKLINDSVNLKGYNYKFIETSELCRSSTERVLQIYEKVDSDIYTSIPIDETALSPKEINRVLKEIVNEQFEAYTLWCDFFCIEDAESPLSAKVVTNQHDEVIYMSRSTIPISKSGKIAPEYLKKNVGVHFFRKNFLHSLNSHRHTDTILDKLEGLEQLRWLELGLKLKAKKIEHFGCGIDVIEQVKQLETRMRCLPKQKKSE